MMTRFYIPLCLLLMASCGTDREKKQTSSQEKLPENVLVPAFNADSAYGFVEKQVAFGPRVQAELLISLLAVSLFSLLFRFRPAWRDLTLEYFRRIAALNPVQRVGKQIGEVPGLASLARAMGTLC